MRGFHRFRDTRILTRRAPHSADLTELGRTPVGVVCAGVKSILDIGLTLEFLETQGVPVATVPGALPGPPVAEFPAFFTRRSGFPAPVALSSPSECASLLHTQHLLGMSNGAVFAAPIPAKYAAAGEVIEAAIQQVCELSNLVFVVTKSQMWSCLFSRPCMNQSS